MAYWLEIHCDLRFDGLDPDNPLRPICWTHRGHNPSGFVTSLTGLRKEAKQQGWKNTSGTTWACPGCFKSMQKALGRTRP